MSLRRYNSDDSETPHRPIDLYHKATSEDGVTIYDPSGIGVRKETWISAVPDVAIELPDAI